MGSSALRALLPALVVLALVGVVAIASGGTTTVGSAGTRRPADQLLDTILSLAFVAFLPAAAFVVYQLVRAMALSRRTSSKRSRWLGLVPVIATMLALAALLRFRNWELPWQEMEPTPIGPQAPPATEEQRGYEPQFAWIPALVVVALVTSGAVAYLLSTRRGADARRTDRDVAETLADVLDGTLDDLRAEADPRRAVIAAYARFERALAAHGLPRGAAETPDEFLRRILGDLDIEPEAVGRLTALYSWAKFSQHTVDVGMKEEAIGALEQVRDELRRARGAQEADGAGLVTARAAS